MFMNNLSRQRIRLACDPAKDQSPLDLITNLAPNLLRGVDVQFELGLFWNDVIQPVSGISSLTLEIREKRTGDPVISSTLTGATLDASLTWESWVNETAQHALFTFTKEQTSLFQISEKGYDEFWLVVRALSSDVPQRRAHWTYGVIRVTEAGIVPSVTDAILPTMPVWQANGYVYARMPFDSTRDYQIAFIKQHVSNNLAHAMADYGNVLVPNSNDYGEVLGVVSIGTWVDEFGPIYITGWQSNGASHNQCQSKISLPNHGLLEAVHRGKRWQDANGTGRKFVLSAIIGHDLYFFAEKTSSGSIQAVPAGNLVSLDGYETLSGYTGAAFTSGAIQPSVFNVSQQFLVDHAPLPASGVVHGTEFKIVSQFDMVDMSEAYPSLVSAIDKSAWTISSLPVVLRVTREITVYPWRQITAKQVLHTFQSGFEFTYLSPVLQRNKMTYLAPFSHNWIWLPGAKTKGSMAVGTPACISSWINTDWFKDPNDCDDLNTLPDVQFAWRAESSSQLSKSNFVAGCALGIDPILEDGIYRSSRVDLGARFWTINQVGKSYPYYDSGRAPSTSETDKVSGFYAVWPPLAENLLAKFWLKSGHLWLVYLAWNDTGTVTVPLPNYLAGYNASLVRSVHGSLISAGTGTDHQLVINKTSVNGYLIVKLTLAA